MEEDVVNYKQYKMGFSQKRCLTDAVLPSTFQCQPYQRRLRDFCISGTVFLPSQRKDVVEYCEQLTKENLIETTVRKDEKAIIKMGSQKYIY